MSGKRVLYLEDDARLREQVCAYLAERGYQVEPAHSVQEARSVLARAEVDVAVVDGLLPGLSGPEFIQELRQTRPSLPVLFASAYWRDAASRELLIDKLRVERILHKPYTPQELFVWVEQVLSARRPAAPAGPVAPATPAVSPPAPGEPDLTAELAALNADYAAHLPGKLAAMTAAVERARAGERGALEEVYHAAHKLHGSAGSFGQALVGVAAGRLEAALKPAREGAVPDWSAIEAALREVAARMAPPGGGGASPGPAAEGAPTAGAPAAASAAVPNMVGTVLVVDEDLAWLSEVERLGRDRMVRVVGARSADEAVEQARRQWLDGALLHMHLGGPEGGIPAAARLRGEPGLQSLPLAFCSADGDLAHRVAAVHAGASVYLPRPFGAMDFTGAVERLVAARRPERSRVLVLDDDVDAVRALSQAVAGDQVEVVGLSDPFLLVEALAEHRPELLLLDVGMPGPSGFDLCRIVRSMPEWQELPILFITAYTGVEFRVAAFQAGADDYLTKPVLREELVARVHSRLERAKLARERAERDALTGLLLRRPFLEGVRARLSEATRQHRPLALCFLDVDHFKQVNDTHGHLAGDRVLTRLGRLLSTRFRKEDVRGRWGGEEFVVALMGETAASAREILARTAAELAAVEFESDLGEGFHVAFSAGIAQAPTDGEDVETLLRVADERLYQAKAHGRNRIEI